MVHVILLQNEGVLRPDEGGRERLVTGHRGQNKECSLFSHLQHIQVIDTLIKASSVLTADGKLLLLLLCSEPEQRKSCYLFI